MCVCVCVCVCVCIYICIYIFIELIIINTYRRSFLSVRYPKLHASTASTPTRRPYALCSAQHAVTIYSHTVC